MARNNMTFTASMRLRTNEFKKGVAQIRGSLDSLRRSFASLAGGLGLGLSLGKLSSSLMDTATKLSVAKQTLDNVSESTKEYGQSLEWLREISQEYGQDLVVLTNQFAQYRAAAKSTSLSIDELRAIYEALTRAAGAYHMSADRTKDMMIAVQQMFSKSKVTAEELRRQLGNSLPGAFNLMTEAAYRAGVISKNSTAELEKMMRAGKVSAEQVMPEFAKVLNEVTAAANFESLQTSLNRFKNTWTEMVEAGGFENIFKGLVDGANNALSFMKEGFWRKIISGAAGLAAAISGPRIFKNFVANAKASAAAMEDAYWKSSKEMIKAMEAVDGFKARKGLENGLATHVTDRWVKYQKADAAAIKASSSSIREYHRNLNDATVAAVNFNNALIEKNKYLKASGGRAFLTKSDIREIKDANDEMISLVNNTRSAGGRVSALTGAFQVLGRIGSAALRMVGSAIMSIGIGLLVAGITNLITKLVEAHKEAKRLRDMAENAVGEIEKISVEGNASLAKVALIRDALNEIDGNTSGAAKQQYIDKINKALGRTKDNMFTIASSIKDEVIPAVDDWLNRQIQLIRQQAIINKVLELEGKRLSLEVENTSIKGDKKYNEEAYTYIPGSPTIGQMGTYVKGLSRDAQKLHYQFDKNTKEIAAIDETIKSLMNYAKEGNYDLSGLNPESPTTTTTTTTNNDDGPTEKKTPTSVWLDYVKKHGELENQFKNGAILAAEYDKKMRDLKKSTYLSLSAFGDWEKVVLKGTGPKRKEGMNRLKKTAMGYILEDLSKDNMEEIDAYDAEMEKQADEAYERWREAYWKFHEFVKKSPIPVDIDLSDANLKSRKRGKGQTYSEYETYVSGQSFKAYEKYVSDLENFQRDVEEAIAKGTFPQYARELEQLLDNIATKLEFARMSAGNFKKAVDIASIEKEISKLKKDLDSALMSSLTTLADGMDRLYRSLQSLYSAFGEKLEWEGFEEFAAALNFGIQLLETTKTVIDAVRTAKEIYAKVAEKAAQRAAIANTAEAASETAKASAAGKAAAAEGAAATAGIPVVGPMLAIAAVGAIVAAIISGMGKFANGGIIGGSSYSGDKQLARVNSGEMILNKGQQATLFNAIKSGNLGGGGEVQFKIRGADLVGTLNNYRRVVK